MALTMKYQLNTQFEFTIFILCIHFRQISILFLTFISQRAIKTYSNGRKQIRYFRLQFLQKAEEKKTDPHAEGLNI